MSPAHSGDFNLFLQACAATHEHDETGRLYVNVTVASVMQGVR